MRIIDNLRVFYFVFLLFMVSCGQTKPPEFNAERSFADLKTQVDFGPRVPNSRAHRACSDWLIQQLKKTSKQVAAQRFDSPWADSSLHMVNIIASYNLAAQKRIMLAAHWDSRPMADQDIAINRNKPIPGANDGASGVAVLLEIGRLLKLKQPLVGVDIVLFDGEDWGAEGHNEDYFIGSRYFAKNLKTYRPQYGILLDMVGDADLHLPVEYQSQRLAPQIVDKVWSSGAALGYTEFEKRMGPAVNDDHMMMLNAGIPFIDIIDFSYSGKDGNYWHTLKDTPDKCSPKSLKVVGQTLLKVIFDEAP